VDTKIILPEKELPKAWFNIQPFLPRPLKPPLHPKTGEPIKPEDLLPIFPMALIEQEVTQEPYVPIPEEVREVYKLWRPSPLKRAHRLERELKTPARIYYKDESVSPAGSHKPNTAVAQAYYNKKEGVTRLATETGAGQWGSALSFACKLFGLKCTVYMVKVSYEQKPYRKTLMNVWGGEVFPSPSERTEVGRKILSQDPESPGSLGIAISEAIEDAVTHENTKYSLGSVLNHVLLHQTIVGLEAQKQFSLIGDYPDIIVGCVGGGSNFSGLCFPFAKEKIEGKKDTEIIAVEPTSCPTLTKGLYRYDFGDTAGMTPLIYMHTLGHKFIPAKIHAGGLRYHGNAPLLCALVEERVIKARAYTQNPVFEAAVLFARHEGIIPASETAHCVKAAIDEALKCKETGEEKAILIGFSGHGHFDLAAYETYLHGELRDYTYPEEKIQEALKDLPQIP